MLINYNFNNVPLLPQANRVVCNDSRRPLFRYDSYLCPSYARTSLGCVSFSEDRIPERLRNPSSGPLDSRDALHIVDSVTDRY